MKPVKVKFLPRGDYTLDLKAKQAHVTEEGHSNVEKLMVQYGLLEEGASLYDPGNIRLLHHLNAALRAQNQSMREGMRRCVTCDYRIDFKNRQGQAPVETTPAE